MKIAIEMFVSIIFLTILILISTQLISAQLQIRNAKVFHLNVVKQIEASNYNAVTLDEMKKKAHLHGYSIEAEINRINKAKCNKCNSVWDVSSGRSHCLNCESQDVIYTYTQYRGTINMSYDIELPTLSIEEKGFVSAVIR